MKLEDSVFGTVAIDDPAALDLIATPTFQRLRHIHQAGPSALVFPERTTTRHDHSLGVYVLLGRVGAARIEQIAGLLHDISHTAFSHVVDAVFPSPEQNFHERHKLAFLQRADVCEVLQRHGMTAEDFADDARFGLLEQPLPALCADRIDYFLRDGLASGLLGQGFVSALLEDLCVQSGRLACRDLEIARRAARAFREVDGALWSSVRDRHIYDRFSGALRIALDRGVLTLEDLFEDDARVLRQLKRAQLPEIDRLLAEMHAEPRAGDAPTTEAKKRWLDPDVCREGRCEPLSRWDGTELARAVASVRIGLR